MTQKACNHSASTQNYLCQATWAYKAQKNFWREGQIFQQTHSAKHLPAKVKALQNTVLTYKYSLGEKEYSNLCSKNSINC